MSKQACSTCGTIPTRAKGLCSRCYRRYNYAANPEARREAFRSWYYRTKSALTPEDCGAVILGLVGRLSGEPCSAEMYIDYLGWLRMQTQRTALKLRLAGLIYQNMKRYRTEQRLVRERGVA